MFKWIRRPGGLLIVLFILLVDLVGSLELFTEGGS